MKVLHILNTNKFSGAEDVVCQIIDIFKNEADIEMLYCSPDGPIRQALEERNINFVPITALNTKEIKRVISEQKPDIIHSHDITASFVAAAACKGVKIINTIHGNSFSMRKLSVKSILYKLAAKKASHIFWVSKSCLDNFKFKKSVLQKSSVLYNVIDDKNLYKRIDECNEECKAYDVVYVGRISPEKNPLRLIEVISLCAKTNPEITVAIIGNGELLEEVKLKSKELGVENNIDFLGFVSNPYKIMSKAKVMIMTSRFEGTPMCSLEAMALGLAIVSTPTDGLCELVEEGVTGFLSDDTKCLAEKITYICSNESAHLEMKENTLKRFAKLNDLKEFKGALDKVYNI